jgi:hypothetical protein
VLESVFLSKRLDVRPSSLEDVAARWHRGLERTGWSSRVVRVGRGCWLSSEARVSSAEYEVDGLVWSCGRPVSFILEFAGWSKTQSEVGVSPRSLSWPVGTVPYVRRVRAALESIGVALSSSPSEVEAVPEGATDAAVSLAGAWPGLLVPAHL